MPDVQPPAKKHQPQAKWVSGRLEVGGKRVLMLDASGGFYGLKKTLRADVGGFERDFLFRAGEESARAFLSDLSERDLSDQRAALDAALGAFAVRGAGEFKIELFEPDKKVIEISCHDSVEATPFQEANDLQREPNCAFLAGALLWMCRLILAPKNPLDLDLSAHESECAATGARRCYFVFAPEAALRSRFPEYARPRRLVPEQVLRLNEEILSRNLELQNINLSLERLIKRKTEEVWRAEENYSLLMRLSPDPIALVFTDGRVHSMNPRGLRMFGFESSEEAQNESITSYMSGGRTLWDQFIWQIEKEGSVHDFEVEFHDKKGRRVYATASGRVTDLIPGRCIETVIKDLTERRELEKEIEDARSESEFLNDLLSHDIMNFTFSALHFLNSLWKSQRISEDDRRDLAMAMKDIQGAYELTASVRDLARIRHLEESELIIKDLKHIVTEASEETRRLFPERTISITYDRTAGARYVRCTPLATRVFTNILSNAVKYDPNPEAIIDVVVDSIVSDGQVFWRTKIIDHGKGIPDAEKQRIFERFHRLDQVVSGTGLGLYVAKFITEAGGGKIWAEDRVPGDHSKGTTLVVLMKKADERDVALMPMKS